MTSHPDVTGFFDPATATVTYLVADPATRRAAIIDPVLDYQPNSGRTSTASADAVLAAVRAPGLTVDWILETHVHADHLTAAPHMKKATGAPVGIGAEIVKVQKVFGGMFNNMDSVAADGRDFDRLFRDGDTFAIGGLAARVMHTPGHTPACVTYVIGDAAFVGDTIFMPDYGSARCDFPGGDAATLYRSVQKILSLPETTRIFVGHDYPPNGRAAAWETTVKAEKQGNIHIGGKSEAEFVAMRTARDKTLSLPNLILPSVQINMRGGKWPPAEANGVSYIKLPLNVF
ncbi:MAG: MBL fold metallo-hydrolase [Rhodospirillaceae bacterium]|nr:MBL fold metallo-hydrolase [Rhodospirillaceae bacterium]